MTQSQIHRSTAIQLSVPPTQGTPSNRGLCKLEPPRPPARSNWQVPRDFKPRPTGDPPFANAGLRNLQESPTAPLRLPCVPPFCFPKTPARQWLTRARSSLTSLGRSEPNRAHHDPPRPRPPRAPRGLRLQVRRQGAGCQHVVLRTAPPQPRAAETWLGSWCCIANGSFCS